MATTQHRILAFWNFSDRIAYRLFVDVQASSGCIRFARQVWQLVCRYCLRPAPVYNDGLS